MDCIDKIISFVSTSEDLNKLGNSNLVNALMWSLKVNDDLVIYSKHSKIITFEFLVVKLDIMSASKLTSGIMLMQSMLSVGTITSAVVDSKLVISYVFQIQPSSIDKDLEELFKASIKEIDNLRAGVEEGKRLIKQSMYPKGMIDFDKLEELLD